MRLAGDAIVSGTVEFRPGRYEGGGAPYMRFRNWLARLSDETPPGLIAFEEVRRHIGTDAAHSYGGFLAILTSWCEWQKMPYRGIPVGTIKRHATGKGNADKAAMMAAMRARGFKPGDDNEADALALLDYVIQGETA